MASNYTSYKNSVGINLSNFKRDINAAGIYDRRDLEWFDKFNRFGYIDPYNTVNHAKEYLFFTKPDLHLFKNSSSSSLNTELENIPFFMEMKKNYKPVLEQLQESCSSSNGPFIKILSNSVKNTLDMPTLTAKTIETSATIYGTKQNYRSMSTGDEDHEFSLEFEDTKYLDLYMFFKCWDEYSGLKALGLVTPPDDNYIINKILHDQIAIYKFIVGEDGQNIIYYSKGFGCCPTGVPREAFSDMDKNGGLIYSVPWRAFVIEDMNPLILKDFNKLVSGYMSSTSDMPLYDRTNHLPNSKWATIPYIYESRSGDLDPTYRRYNYKLRWR
ncbi:MAG: hypothetical protein M0P49_00430 [Bacilli bacterium]|nr:hypothetical protein [Bacilli bacterium]